MGIYNQRNATILAIIVIILAIVIAFLLLSGPSQKENAGNSNQTEKNSTPLVIMTPTPTLMSEKNLTKETLGITIGNCAHADPYTLGIGLTNPQNAPVSVNISIDGRISNYTLSGNEIRAVQPGFNTNSDGEKTLHIRIYVNGQLAYNQTIATYCGSSGSSGNSMETLPTPTTQPTANVPMPTPPAPVPEIPSIGLALLGAMGMIFLVLRKKEK